ncbi:tRNA dimethylallyltransferase 2 [Citrus sinensis]|uniref:tRNA dimethylallyltransferase 2 n=1 Tax=Citrus sinensis TaxID=2711 RepID=A0ACB8ISS1_CITSI|nr:tRNA dimethylallyltransferase 2 [Citrus sinensis]
MENGGSKQRALNKPNLVIIMGPTGSGKSKLAVDLASHFPIEIINADSMQVYQGLDVLTNKVSLQDQKGLSPFSFSVYVLQCSFLWIVMFSCVFGLNGFCLSSDFVGVPHHLLGTVSPNVEFTAKEFRDSAVPLISEILSRDHIPFIVGGTNYYIQALVSPFLLDDSAEDMDESCFGSLSGDEPVGPDSDLARDSSSYSYDLLKDLDPVAANRIHPNNYRKINQYLSLYARTGVLPSKLYQGKAAEAMLMMFQLLKCFQLMFLNGVNMPDFLFDSEIWSRTRQNWGRVDNFRFNCCFICVDAANPVLDRYVEQRVDCMIDAGLLDEVYDIYNANADYTRGLRQAIGVREFEDFLSVYHSVDRDNKTSGPTNATLNSRNKDDKTLKDCMRAILKSSADDQLKVLLEEAIDRVKLNTRRLVRCQKRRLNQLQTLFGWDIHYVDSTESISCKSDEVWTAQVVGPAVKIIRAFLSEDERLMPNLAGMIGTSVNSTERDLWTQYVCKACGDKVLRGAYEWEQHKQGRRHRKRIYNLRKSQRFSSAGQQHQQQNTSVATEQSSMSCQVQI